MAIPPGQPNKPNRVVAACLDGKRLKGYVFNFSALRDSFRLFPEENAPQHSGTDIELVTVKAIFFVKDFAGDPERKDASDPVVFAHGRKLEITFHDGEKVTGTTEAYNPAKAGFFVFPADKESNNSRIFIVARNARQVKLL
jgi:hypothetical protein